MPQERMRPSNARRSRVYEAQMQHEKAVSIKWQNKFGDILDRSTEKIGLVDVVKPRWWKQVEFNVAHNAGLARPLAEVVPIVKLPPKVRRFPPHKEPGPEIVDHLPPISLQHPIEDQLRTVLLSDYRGRQQWLRDRRKLPMNVRFVKAPNVNGDYGWGVITAVHSGNEEIDKRFGKTPVLKTEFYRQNGVMNGRTRSVILDNTSNKGKD